MGTESREADMGPILFLLFIVVPLLELAVIIQVGQAIGALYTVALLLVISLAGATLVKREGLKAWSRFRLAVAEGRVPTKEVVDGALLLLGGALLLTPGFLTDAVGLALLIPVARAGIRRLVRGRILVVSPSGSRQSGGRRQQAGQAGRSPGSGRVGGAGPRSDSGDTVVDVEVVEIRRNDGTEDGDQR